VFCLRISVTHHPQEDGGIDVNQRQVFDVMIIQKKNQRSCKKDVDGNPLNEFETEEILHQPQFLASHIK
jgi:hypothetical protein